MKWKHCFNEYKLLIKNVTLTLPKTNHPFSITEDFSMIGVGCDLFQNNDKRKIDNISYISRTFLTN